MEKAAPFAKNPIKDNLIHLAPDQIVGEWRDSTYGTQPIDSPIAAID